MAWTKILDDHDAGNVDTDRLYVGGKGKVTVLVEGTVGGHIMTPKAVTNVPGGTEVAEAIRIVNDADGTYKTITCDEAGYFTFPCPGEWFYISLAGGTSTNLNIWASAF